MYLKTNRKVKMDWTNANENEEGELCGRMSYIWYNWISPNLFFESVRAHLWFQGVEWCVLVWFFNYYGSNCIMCRLPNENDIITLDNSIFTIVTMLSFSKKFT